MDLKFKITTSSFPAGFSSSYGHSSSAKSLKLEAHKLIWDALFYNEWKTVIRVIRDWNADGHCLGEEWMSTNGDSFGCGQGPGHRAMRFRPFQGPRSSHPVLPLFISTFVCLINSTPLVSPLLKTNNQKDGFKTNCPTCTLRQNSKLWSLRWECCDQLE